VTEFEYKKAIFLLYFATLKCEFDPNVKQKYNG
jgi:hypothetical protein